MEERSIKTLKAWLAFGRGFTLDEVIAMEARILHSLDFKLSLPTNLSFFYIFSTYYSLSSRTMSLCSYLVELTLIDCHYLKYKGHLIGLAAIYLAFKILDINVQDDVSQ
jgi:cyclin A